MHVFVLAHQVFLREPLQVTVLGSNHDWDIAKGDSYFLLGLVVDLSANCRVHGCLIGKRPQPALIWVHNLTVNYFFRVFKSFFAVLASFIVICANNETLACCVGALWSTNLEVFKPNGVLFKWPWS